VRREWEDLVASWTLVEQDERELVAYKRGTTRLGFALMLKFFEIDGSSAGRDRLWISAWVTASM